VYNVNLSSVTPNSSTNQPVRLPLSRDRVLQAAVGIADKEGLGSLTMRKLGHDLDVEAMALYRHVQGKSDILDGIVDLVLSEIDLSPFSDNWRMSLRASGISAHEALLRHPWACGLVLSPNLRTIPSRMLYIESILARLRAAGYSPFAASRGYHAIDSHILGFTLWELGHTIPGDSSGELLETFIRQFDYASFPFLGEHLREHLKGSDPGEIGDFEFGLDLILDGIEGIVVTR
jgi:AcrR family transcriptional regulator